MTQWRTLTYPVSRSFRMTRCETFLCLQWSWYSSKAYKYTTVYNVSFLLKFKCSDGRQEKRLLCAQNYPGWQQSCKGAEPPEMTALQCDLATCYCYLLYGNALSTVSFEYFIGPGSILWGHWLPLFWTLCDRPYGF